MGYAFLVHFNTMFPVYMAVLGLSIYFLIFTISYIAHIRNG
jgi:hypothetical protein